ncbi:unknown protein [Mesoplasma florum L1]|uniref:Thoeris protein ThsB TIR-like domain-containing protein n=1 Tax=Mesoplasma florum (strain ATCC 33453 / NBRC 100688 / NCTC 11704 / L1) TaxID=265311 RepID=Q6F1E6_MESFL|nr:TIR domain-containing protein [Mesoplasma florum]AAT75677.1 unknown protein [Mesoplasma florum L1]
MNKKVFISYWHSGHQIQKDELEKTVRASRNINNSVHIGDINENLPTERIYQIIRDDYLKDSQVTIVLLGLHTNHRKHIDREIASSIRETFLNPRNGLVILVMPEMVPYVSAGTWNSERICGPRISKNIKNNYAVFDYYHNVINNPSKLNELIEKAYLNRNNVLPNNSDPYRSNNTSCTICGR